MDDPKALWRSILAARDRGDWAGIGQPSRRLLAFEPSNAEALHLFGMALVNTGAGPIGADQVGRAAAIAATAGGILVDLAYVRLAAAQPELARRAARRAVAVQPASAMALCNLALADHRMGDFDFAESHYRRTTWTDPALSEPYAGLMMIFTAEDRWADLEVACRHHLRRDPVNAVVLYDLAWALAGQGRRSEEAAVLDDLLRVSPGHADAFYRRYRLAADKPLPSDFEARAASAASALIAEGRAYDRQGLIVQAAETYERATCYAPRDRELLGLVDHATDRGLAGLEFSGLSEIQRTTVCANFTRQRAAAVYRNAIEEPPPPTGRAPRVFDCFTFYNEFDLLDVRLNELSSVVDKFVIVESHWTSRGDRKPLLFLENRDKYAKYADRIIHVAETEKVSTFAHLQFAQQKLRGLDGLTTAEDWDLVMTADLDEIPRADALRQAVRQMTGVWDFARLSMDLYQYFLNTRVFRKWSGAAISPAGLLRRITPIGSHHLAGLTRLGLTQADTGWHFTWLGGPDGIISKIKAYNHKEMDDPVITDRKRIIERLSRLEHVVEHGNERRYLYGAIRRVDERSLPAFIQANRRYFEEKDLFNFGPTKS